MDGKGLVVKWMVEEAGRSVLILYIPVDLELVSIMLIFRLYKKSDLVSCLKCCCSYYKN